MSIIKKIFRNVVFNRQTIPIFSRINDISEEYYKDVRTTLNNVLKEKEDQIVDSIEKVLSGDKIKLKKKANVDYTKLIETHEDIENGTIKLSGISNFEPKSSDEIIKILKIDTKKWKLSQYWNKQSSDKWYISALVTRLPKEESTLTKIEEQLSKMSLSQIKSLKPIKTILKPTNSDKVCGILSFQDLRSRLGPNA